MQDVDGVFVSLLKPVEAIFPFFLDGHIEDFINNKIFRADFYFHTGSYFADSLACPILFAAGTLDLPQRANLHSSFDLARPDYSSGHRARSACTRPAYKQDRAGLQLLAVIKRRLFKLNVSFDICTGETFETAGFLDPTVFKAIFS